MNLIETLKHDLLQARKDGDHPRTEALRFIVGEAERYAKGSTRDKNLSGHPLSDTETLRLLQGAVVNLDASIEQASRLGRDTADAQAQRALFSSYLPAMLAREELHGAIREILLHRPNPGLGDVMRELAVRYPRRYDGALARQLAQELLRAAAGAPDLTAQPS